MLNLKELIDNLNQNKEWMTKREVVKTIITIMILKKNKSKKFWINIHNNYKQDDKSVDLYFEDLKESKVILYKLVNNISEKRRIRLKEDLSEIRTGLIENKTIKIIDLKNISSDIKEIEQDLMDKI